MFKNIPITLFLTFPTKKLFPHTLSLTKLDHAAPDSTINIKLSINIPIEVKKNMFK